MPIQTQQKLIDELEGSRWIPIDERSQKRTHTFWCPLRTANMPDIARYEEDKNGAHSIRAMRKEVINRLD